jgi:hypothetical protein
MRLTSHPLLLIDGLGALLSAFLLGVVLVQLEHLVGMPIRACYLLAIWPVLFALFDGWAYFFAPSPHSRYLRIIAYLNFGYCGFSASMIVRHAEQLTHWGWLYFGLEIAIVLSLATVELWVARREA